MTALIAVASVLAYLTLTLLAARHRFQAIRPYTEPLACEWPYHGDGAHRERCYSRPGTSADTKGEALFFALLTGLAWPLIIPFTIPARAVGRFVTGGARQLPAEVAAETRRLEAENERLRQQQEPSQP